MANKRSGAIRLRPFLSPRCKSLLSDDSADQEAATNQQDAGAESKQ